MEMDINRHDAAGSVFRRNEMRRYNTNEEQIEANTGLVLQSFSFAIQVFFMFRDHCYPTTFDGHCRRAFQFPNKSGTTSLHLCSLGAYKRYAGHADMLILHLQNR